MKKELKVLGLAVGVVAIMALILGGTVFANTPEETDCAGYGGHGFHGEGAVCSETVSDLLGLTTDELCDLRQEGKSLADIAAEQGVTVDRLVAAIMVEKTEAVQARVGDGTLTQEHADLMIQQMTERTELAVNRTTIGPVEGHMGGGTGMANRWGGQNGMGDCYGDAETGVGMGGMNQWGRGAR
ncbi:hypothetical protein ACFLUS_01275 [Chloroflexota bacterium]